MARLAEDLDYGSGAAHLGWCGFCLPWLRCDRVGRRAGCLAGPWVGLLAASNEAAIPSNYIARLIAADKIDTSVLMRWWGCLRDDPMALPWASGLRLIWSRSRRRAWCYP
jgi:hypothetical protein